MSNNTFVIEENPDNLNYDIKKKPREHKQKQNPTPDTAFSPDKLEDSVKRSGMLSEFLNLKIKDAVKQKEEEYKNQLEAEKARLKEERERERAEEMKKKLEEEEKQKKIELLKNKIKQKRCQVSVFKL